MNGKERLKAIHGRKSHDRPPIVTLVDDITRRGMDGELRAMTPIDFYKRIGYDIYQFGNYGLSGNAAVKYPYKTVWKDVTFRDTDLGDGSVEHAMEASCGRLTWVMGGAHPVKYPAETVDDLKVMTRMWRDMEYIADLDGCEDTYTRMDGLLGAHGIYVPTVGPSPLQALLENDIGMERFYPMLQDYPREIHALMEVMHDRKCRGAYRLIAEHMPYDACIAVENTSTTMLSPDLYSPIIRRKNLSNTWRTSSPIG